jgi:nicotinamide mononucleotide transporter
MTSFIQYLTDLPLLELIAMLLSLAYVLLAARGSIWCWPAAFISTGIYSVIFYDVSLLMDSLLSAYYLVMAVYGFWMWRTHSKKDAKKTAKSLSSDNFKVISWSCRIHLIACLSLTFCGFGLGYVMDNYTNASFAYLDTFTTVFAVFATYLVTQKVLENWLYWVVIDFVSIYLYIEKGLMPTVVLFIFYVIIAGYGFIKWRAIYQSNRLKSNTLSKTLSHDSNNTLNDAKN